MKFTTLSQYLQTLEATASRLEITAILAKIFQDLSEEEVQHTCYLLQGQLLPQYMGLEFQIAVKTVIKVLARLQPSATAEMPSLFGEQLNQPPAVVLVEKKYKQVGDLGKVAEEVVELYRSGHPLEQDLTILEVYEKLLEIAKESGGQSQQRKQDKVVALCEQLDPVSAKFVTRIMLGRLRLGFSDMTLMDSLSWAMCGDKSEREMLEAAYQRRADIGVLAHEYLKILDKDQRRKALEENYMIALGTPVVPALCQRLNSTTEVIEKMREVIAEPKYDGLRVQIHFQQGQPPLLRTFTRNLEETSSMFPELHDIPSFLHCQSCVLDAEAIGYDPSTGHLISFQQTIQRKRKHGVAEKALEVPVRFYVFDLLYLDGKNLIDQPLTERKEKLKALFSDNQILIHTEEFRTSDPVELLKYHQHALAEGLEGVVMKQVDAGYQSGRKGWSWVKMKEAEGQSGKLNDTLDVIVMGYYYGRGKRAGFGIGACLTGIWDEATQRVLTLAKIGTGLTDETLAEVKVRCDQLQTPDQPAEYKVNSMLQPDVWCLPGLVVEVAADELTTSPIHTAGQALRFPRFMKFRDDKNWQQSTSLVELQGIQISR